MRPRRRNAPVGATSFTRGLGHVRKLHPPGQGLAKKFSLPPSLKPREISGTDACGLLKNVGRSVEAGRDFAGHALSKPRVSGNDPSERKRFPFFGALSGDELDKAVCAK